MNENQMNPDNNTEVSFDKQFVIMFKFRQLIQYGVSIERIVFPKSYEYINDFLNGIDKVETGQDENNAPICGDYLAKKFKKDMEAMILLNMPEDLVDTIKNYDMLKVKTKYRIRNERWTKEKGKAKVAIYNNFQKDYPFQDI